MPDGLTSIFNDRSLRKLWRPLTTRLFDQKVMKPPRCHTKRTIKENFSYYTASRPLLQENDSYEKFAEWFGDVVAVYLVSRASFPAVSARQMCNGLVTYRTATLVLEYRRHTYHACPLRAVPVRYLQLLGEYSPKQSPLHALAQLTHPDSVVSLFDTSPKVRSHEILALAFVDDIPNVSVCTDLKISSSGPSTTTTTTTTTVAMDEDADDDATEDELDYELANMPISKFVL